MDRFGRNYKCSKKVKINNPCEPINLIGHSLGGSTVALASNELAFKGIMVDLLVTVDPVGFPLSKRKPDVKALHWINFNATPKNSDKSDLIAFMGGKWGQWPENKATEHYNVPFNHRDFEGIMKFKYKNGNCAQSLLSSNNLSSCLN